MEEQRKILRIGPDLAFLFSERSGDFCLACGKKAEHPLIYYDVAIEQDGQTTAISLEDLLNIFGTALENYHDLLASYNEKHPKEVLQAEESLKKEQEGIDSLREVMQ